jgi:hypothetical protein
VSHGGAAPGLDKSILTTVDKLIAGSIARVVAQTALHPLGARERVRAPRESRRDLRPAGDAGHPTTRDVIRGAMCDARPPPLFGASRSRRRAPAARDVIRTRKQASGVTVSYDARTLGRGIWPQSVLSAPAGAIQFLTLELVVAALKQRCPGLPLAAVDLVAGACGATAAASVRIPQELVKQGCQVRAPSGRGGRLGDDQR